MVNRIKILFFIFLCSSPLLSVSSFPASAAEAEIEVLESTARGMSLQFCPPELEVGERTIDGQTCTVLYSQGCGFTSEEGRPRIPSFGFALGIPPDVKVEISAVGSELIRRQVGRICPNPFLEVIQSSEKESRVIERYELDSVFYSTSGSYPDRIATITDLGYMRGNRVASLRVCPFQYRPSAGQLLIYQK
ncbi:MAG: hypothetical protein KAT86_06130, partial [Candidatus Latescibacteria bacterium]|nr:hypothetical protein [Candidatus Latescibacterota bacterium]